MCKDHKHGKINRRQALTGGLAATAGAAALAGSTSSANAQNDPYADPTNPALATQHYEAGPVACRIGCD